jgi:hypothetical protein
MAPDRAASSGTQHTMTAGNMASDAADGSALDATLRRRSAGQAGKRGKQAQGNQFGFHGISSKSGWTRCRE